MMKQQKCSWFDSPVTCVVLAAGKGSRAYPATLVLPKVLLPIHGIPVLKYVVDFWRLFTDRFIFVVGYKKEMVAEYVTSLPIQARTVEQKELRGIAHAVSLSRDLVTPKFIVVLGDCYCEGRFDFPPDMKQGIGVWETNDTEAIKRSYSVETDNGRTVRVVEKPRELVNNLCGMGYYFFDSTVFQYITRTPPSKIRNEVEITDVIQHMIDGGADITPVRFSGRYMNITYEQDIRDLATDH